MNQTPACPDVPDDDRFSRMLDYATYLQRLVEALCHGTSIPEPAGEARHHYRMAVHYRETTELADRASRALPSTALAARPEEGWKLVPIKPTASMLGHADGLTDLICGDGGDRDARLQEFALAWRLMLEHAPPAPSTPPTAGDGHD